MNYHRNSKKGRIIKVFQSIEPKGSPLKAKEIEFFFQVLWPKSRYPITAQEAANLCACMVEVEKVGKADGVSLWALKKEVGA